MGKWKYCFMPGKRAIGSQFIELLSALAAVEKGMNHLLLPRIEPQFLDHIPRIP